MPRYRDDWVIDRVMFDYLSGGQCACCGLTSTTSHVRPVVFLPNGVADLIEAVSDLEPEEMQREIKALSMHHHPWPQDIRDQVWMDRVKLRQSMKQERKLYQLFWNEHQANFTRWMTTTESSSSLQTILQLDPSHILYILQNKYKIQSTYVGVLNAVVDQVAKFHLTHYPVDGRGHAEVQFEQALLYNMKNNRFVFDCQKNKRWRDIWLQRHASLGGPTLLERGSTNATTVENASSTGSSFRSDRRIIRLLIARCWADVLQRKFLQETACLDQSPTVSLSTPNNNDNT